MSEHECVIGMYYNYEETKLVTIDQLLQEIENDFKHYDLLQSLGIKRSTSPYTLKDYCDRRKSTYLTRFEFCPYCGKKIDWNKLKSEGKE